MQSVYSLGLINALQKRSHNLDSNAGNHKRESGNGIYIWLILVSKKVITLGMKSWVATGTA